MHISEGVLQGLGGGRGWMALGEWSGMIDHLRAFLFSGLNAMSAAYIG